MIICLIMLRILFLFLLLDLELFQHQFYVFNVIIRSNLAYIWLKFESTNVMLQIPLLLTMKHKKAHMIVDEKVPDLMNCHVFNLH